MISTYAGGAPPPTPAAAMTVHIGWARGVAADGAGNVYFASADLNSVFKLDNNGIVTRVAGNSRPGFVGDGGPATSAQLNTPISIAIDRNGNLFIADFLNRKIRRVSPGGIIATVADRVTAGTPAGGGPPVSGIMATDGAGNLFLANGCRVVEVATSGIINTVAGNGTCGVSGDGGPATDAQISGAASVAVDAAGNLFIACQLGGIRKVSSRGVISTLADSEFGSLAVDGEDNLFVVENSNQRVRKISSGGPITTVAGSGTAGFEGDGGPATDAQLYNPDSVAFDGAGNMFIAGPVSIRKVSSSGIITSVAGDGWGFFSGDGGPATSAQVYLPRALAADRAGNLFIADENNSRVRKVSPSGIITTVAGNGQPGYSGDGGPAIAAQVGYPYGVAVDGAGNLFIATGNVVRKVSPDGLIATVAGGGAAGLSEGGPAINAQLGISGLAADTAGNLYIADSASLRIRKVSPKGIITTVAGNGIQGFSGDGGPALQAQFDYPSAVAADASGNLFIVDYNNHRVREVSSGGGITTVAGNGMSGSVGDGGPATNAELNPNGVAVDAAGNLLIAGGNLVRKVSSSGIITTVAGGGISNDYPGCFSGDGGPANLATLVYPIAVAFDSAGDIYVAASGDFDEDFAYETCSAIRVLRPGRSSVVIGSVADAAGARVNPISPGKIVVIYGTGLGPSELVQNQATDGLLTTDLAGTRVSFSGLAAPILYTSATQVAAVVPYNISGTTAEVTVSYQGQASNSFSASLAPTAPSLFTVSQTGAGQVSATNAADGTINSAANPVRVGAYISLYATGEGQTSPAGVDGKLGGSVPPRPVFPVTVTVGGIPAFVQYAGGVEAQIAGLLQVNVQIPSGVQPGGYVPVVLQVGSASTTPDAVWIAVAAN
jgi:uncharacterized protein (TIGR03437 family)